MSHSSNNHAWHAPGAPRSCPSFHLMAAAGSIALMAMLAGCGGGGGGDNGGGPVNNGSVIGKVVYTNGSGVSAASITASVSGNSQNQGQNTSLAGGAYRIDGLYPGVYTLTANATVSGVACSGSTQEILHSGDIISNAVIEVSPSNQQGVIDGTVTNAQGQPLSNVRVLATVSVTPAQGSTGTSGLQAITDANGFYKFPLVPTATTPYTLTATAVGFNNATGTVATLSPGQTQTVNLQLTASSSTAAPGTPANVLAASLTQPSSVLTPSIVAHANTSAVTSGSPLPSSVYETIRKIMSPKYAQWAANRHLASASTRLKPRQGGFGAYAVEADVFYTEASTAGVSGYRIYNSSGTSSVSPYDFLEDPLATLYIDLDPYYVPDTQYNFAVSAISTYNVESPISTTASFDPLELETITSPTQGQSVANPVTVNWQAIPGATEYGVFIYNTYPDAATTPVVQATGLSSSTTSYTVSSTLPAGNYWVIVAASDANYIDVSVSQTTPFTVH